jgi:hypothetical protein
MSRLFEHDEFGGMNPWVEFEGKLIRWFDKQDIIRLREQKEAEKQFAAAGFSVAEIERIKKGGM